MTTTSITIQSVLVRKVLRCVLHSGYRIKIKTEYFLRGRQMETSIKNNKQNM